MSWSKSWASKQHGNPLLLFAAAVGFSISIYVGYKKLYYPFASKKKLHQAEEFASFLYEQESKHDITVTERIDQ